MKNHVNYCHSVPKNKFGVFVHHTEDNIPLDDETLLKIINGPIAAVEDKLQEELAKPVIITPEMGVLGVDSLEGEIN